MIVFSFWITGLTCNLREVKGNICKQVIHDTKPTKWLFLRSYKIIPHWIFLHCSVHKRPSSWNQTNAILHKVNSFTFFHRCHGVKESKWLKCRHFFVELLYKCDGSWYTVSWKQPTYFTEVSTVLRVCPVAVKTSCSRRSLLLLKSALFFNHFFIYNLCFLFHFIALLFSSKT